MNTFPFAEPNGTFFCCRIANRDDRMEIHTFEFIGQLRAPFVVNADFVKRRHRLGVNVAGRFWPNAHRFPRFA